MEIKNTTTINRVPSPEEKKAAESTESKETKKETPKKEDKYKIIVNTPEEFEPGIKTTLLTSHSLAQKVNGLLAEVYADYAGCNICINDGSNPIVSEYVGVFGAPYVELFFRYLEGDPAHGKKAITLIGNKNSEVKNYGSMLSQITHATQFALYSTTDYLRETLEPLIVPFGNKNCDWRRLTSEVQHGTNDYVSDKREILMKVSPINLHALIELMYGSFRKDTNNNTKIRYHYMINVVNKINLPAYGQMRVSQNEYMFSINQLDNSLVNRIQKELGIVTSVGTTEGFYHV